jgi:Fungal specific transcription factor domain
MRKSPCAAIVSVLGLQCRASEFITHSAWSAVDGGGQSTTSTEQSPSISSDLDVSLLSSVSSSDSPSRSTSLPSPKATAPTPRSSFVNLTDEAVHVLNVFRSGLATWMDIFDHDCTYQREVGRRALSSELLGRCICAFTAKHLSLLASGEVWRPVASRYYGEALNLLIKELSSPEPQSDALTAAMLLGGYEVLAAQDHEHQRHYLAVLATSSSHRIDAVDAMTMTPATSDAIRMHHRHRHRHPATGVGGRGSGCRGRRRRRRRRRRWSTPLCSI